MTKEQQKKLCQECQTPIDHDDPYPYCMKCRKAYGVKKREEQRRENIEYVNNLSNDQKDAVGGLFKCRAMVDIINEQNGDWRAAMSVANKLLYRRHRTHCTKKRAKEEKHKQEDAEIMPKGIMRLVACVKELEPVSYAFLRRNLQQSLRDTGKKQPSDRTIERWIAAALKKGYIHKDEKTKMYRTETTDI